MKKFISLIVKKTIIYLDVFIHRKKIIKFLKKSNLKFKTIYDIGSNNADYSLLFNQIYSKANIFSFEPNPDLYKIALDNTKKFSNIKIIKKAVGNSNTIKDLKIDQNSSLTTTLSTTNKSSNTYKIKRYLYGENPQNTVKINMIKLDSFINKNNTPDFVKIDVEGFEEEVLKGLQKNVKKIKLVMIEFHFDKLYKGYSTTRLKKFFKKNNFKLIKTIKFPILNWEDRFYLNQINEL